MGLLLCPVCGRPLDDGVPVRRCAGGHSYDRAAKGGYVHLLKQARRGSRVPGDSPEMCRMRTAFLSGGWYAPLREKVAELAAMRQPQTVLDAGCGEGYYTAAVYEACRGMAGFQLVGIDLAKAALRHAGRVCPSAEFAVASIFDLPVADASIDLIVHLFAPLAAAEFARVTKRGGTLLTVTPGARHLWGLKTRLYEKPYENEETERVIDGFRFAARERVQTEITLTDPTDIEALFRMTPYAWKTGREAAARLTAGSPLQTEVSFLIDCYERQ